MEGIYITFLQEIERVRTYWTTFLQSATITVSRMENGKVSSAGGSGGQKSFDPHLSNKVRDEVRTAIHTQQIMLGNCGLTKFPTELSKFLHGSLSGTEITIQRILRLDLSNNYLTSLPDISSLKSLRELWLQHNHGLSSFPPNLCKLSELEIIDIRNTSIADIPSEFAQLRRLYELDWRGTPLALNLSAQTGIQPNDVVSLREMLIKRNDRQLLEENLFAFLRDEQFLMDADIPGIQNLITNLVQVRISRCSP